MNKLPPLPSPNMVHQTHGTTLLGYKEEKLVKWGQACREAALLDAMNATRSFGKTGEVIAMVIRGLK